MKASKPDRWYALVNSSDPNQPRVLFTARTKEEVKAFCRKAKVSGYIDTVDFEPLPMVFRFKADPEAQVQALKIATEGKAGPR